MKYLSIFLLLVGCSFVPKEENRSFSITPSEMQTIQAKSDAFISSEELARWDDRTRELLSTYPSEDGDKHRVFAYLHQAQKAFADASDGKGSIGPISASVLKLFFPNFQNGESSDLFSKELSALVTKKVEARFRFEESHIHPQKLDPYPNSWVGIQPYFGITGPSMQPWKLNSPDEFRPSKPPPPEDPFWQEQLAEVKQQMAQATVKQQKAIHYWNDVADWKKIGADYMKGMSVNKQIEIRAALSCALMDAFIAVFDAKYAYLVRRPNQLDPNLKTVVSTPNHPSYPAGHSTLSGAGAAVMIHYFPENEAEWNRLLKEAGLARIQAGIHFPIDVQSGNELGNNVGKLYH